VSYDDWREYGDLTEAFPDPECYRCATISGVDYSDEHDDYICTECSITTPTTITDKEYHE
jgi:hypothetical protein